jgi:hypothetical protein
MRSWCKIAILFLAALCLTQASVAQSRYTLMQRQSKRMEMGLSVGASFMDVSATEGVVLSPKVGVRGALSMSLEWQESYALQLELGYAHNKVEAERGATLYDVKANVMEIPILFSYRGLGIVRFNVGPVLSLSSAGRYSNGRERVEFGNVRSTLGYAAGVGVELTPKLLVDARLTGNFGRTDNYFEGLEFRSSAMWLTLGIGYMF